MLTIAEATEVSGLTAHTLRYYERAGLLEPGRAENGHRRFTDDDLQRVHFVQKLRATGMPIRDVRRYFAAEPSERLQLLRDHRRQVVSDIEELTGALELIDYKIDLYRKGTTACAS
jgi:DNA-binding transcriptional MerR regulator